MNEHPRRYHSSPNHVIQMLLTDRPTGGISIVARYVISRRNRREISLIPKEGAGFLLPKSKYYPLRKSENSLQFTGK